MSDAAGWDAVRCVVFDFDGTLVDSNPIKRGAYFEVLAGVQGGAEAVERALRELPDADRQGVLSAVHEMLAPRAGLPAVAEWVAAYSALCEERVAACAPLPGAARALDGLADTHALYLDSATPTSALERVVALRGWRDRFRGVLGGPASKHENLLAIAAREGVGPPEMVYVGDGPQDREAAWVFGCAFLGYRAPAGALRESASLGVLAPLVDEIAARSAQG